MNDTKFVGICILLAAFIISGSIIWSAKASQPATAAVAPAEGASVPASVVPTVTSVTISGPVTLAPFAAPIPVTISTPDGSPIVVKEATEKKWTR